MNSASGKKYGLSRLVSRILKTSLQFIAGILAVASMMIAVLLWRLSEGPLSLNFLGPHIEHTLTKGNSSLGLTFQDLNISWSEWEPYIVFQAKSIEVNTSGGEIRAIIPQITAELSVAELFRGSFMFPQLEIANPSLEISLQNITTSPSRSESHSFEEHIPTLFFELYELADNYFPAGVPSQVGELTISSPHVAILRSPDVISWKATSEEWFVKQTMQGTDIVASITLEINDHEFPLKLSAKLEKTSGIWHTQMFFSHLSPAQLAQIDTKLKKLADLHIPVSGKFSTTFNDISRIKIIDFELVSPGGVASFTGDSWFAGEYNMENMRMAGKIILNDSAIFLDRFNAVFDDIEVSGSADFTNLELDPHINAEFNANQIPIDRLSNLWPRNLAKGARTWVLQNVAGGALNDATAYINFSRSELENNALGRGQIFGQFQVSESSVEYMKGLPPAHNIRAAGWFDGPDFHLDIIDGNVLNHDIGGTNLDFIDIYSGNEIGILQLQSAGPLKDFVVLTGLSQDTTSVLPIGKAQNIEGNSIAILEVRFPLLKNLEVEHLNIAGEVKFHDFSPGHNTIRLLGQEVQISNGNGAIIIDGTQIEGSGTILVNDFLMEIQWIKFPEITASGLASKATIRTTMSDNSTTLWKQIMPSNGGKVELVIELTLSVNNTQEAVIAVDISNYEISFPAVNFSKDMGVQANIIGELQLNSWIPASPLYLEIVSDQLGGSGIAELNDNFELTKLTLNNISHKQELITTELLFADGHLQEVDLYTKSLDINSIGLTPENSIFRPHKGRIAAAKMAAGKLASLTDVNIAYNVENQDTTTISLESTDLTLRQSLISVMNGFQTKSKQTNNQTFNVYGTTRKLYSEHGDTLLNVQVQGTVHNGELIQARVEAYFNETEKLRIELSGFGSEQKLTIATDNAGKFLQMLDVTSNLVGGRLYLEAKYENHGEGEALAGHCTVMNFHVTDTPFLAQLLSISVPTNVFELLAGNGLPFARLHAPFEYRNSELKLLKARATGISLGITANGRIDLDAKFADLQGTIIPAYLLNNIVGTVPVIGDILTGSEKEGIFAATYTAQGPTDDMEIFVNPLTVLAPGILRDFLDLFLPDKSEPIQ